MATIKQKADYVRSKMRGASGNHHCHWPGCEKSVPPAMWGCTQHWFMLPQYLRQKIWATFRPGQEETKTPSVNYISVAREVQKWITYHYSVK